MRLPGVFRASASRDHPLQLLVRGKNHDRISGRRKHTEASYGERIEALMPLRQASSPGRTYAEVSRAWGSLADAASLQSGHFSEHERAALYKRAARDTSRLQFPD